MLLVKTFLIHNSRTKVFLDKHYLPNAGQNLMIKLSRNLTTVSATLDLFQTFQINQIFPEKSGSVTLITLAVP